MRIPFASALTARLRSALRRHESPAAARKSHSPLDQAERILARRYARGRITADEFERMSALIRR